MRGQVGDAAQIWEAGPPAQDAGAEGSIVQKQLVSRTAQLHAESSAEECGCL